MADKPLFWQWLDRRNAAQNNYNSGPQVGTNMTPQQLRYAMPPMRDSEVVPTINAAAGPPPVYPPVSADQIMRQLMTPGGPPSNGSMADARAREIAYANSMMPQAGSMEAARAQEIAYANSQPNPAARGGSGGGAGVSANPAGAGGSTPALYMVDFGDGSPVRSYLSKDGKIPEIPGANVFADPSYNPNAGALTKLIRGVF